MTIQEIHSEVKAMFPEASHISIQHNYNDSMDTHEHWGAMVYGHECKCCNRKAEVIASAHMEPTPEALLFSLQLQRKQEDAA